MEIDAIDGLVALGLVSSEEAAAAASVPDPSLGRLGRLALVGVDVGALLPTLAAFARIPLATAEHLQASAAPPLAPAAQSALAALPACPVLRPDGSVEVVLSDPKVRPQIAVVMGPMFRACLAAEEPLRALCARLLSAATPGAGAAPTLAPAPTGGPAATAVAPRAPSVANHEMAAFVEAPRARAAGLSGAALAAALAEPVDLSDAAKKRILDLDARIDGASPAELLGVAPGTSANDIKERYYELSREFHPDAHFRKKLGSYKARIQRVFRALKKACDTLVVDAEKRDHLDLDLALPSAGPAAGTGTAPGKAAAPGKGAAPGVGPSAPSPATPATAFPARPFANPFEAAQAPMPPRPRPPTPAAGVSLELDGPLRGNSAINSAMNSGTSSASAAANPHRPRTGAVARPSSSSRPAVDRRVLLAAAALVGLVLVVGVGALALRGGGGTRESLATDPAARQAQLVERAREEHRAGNHAEALAFATEAIKLMPTSPAAAQALAVRGSASIDNGDRAEGFADLEEAIRRLPPGDAIRNEAEAVLRRHRP